MSDRITELPVLQVRPQEQASPPRPAPAAAAGGGEGEEPDLEALAAKLDEVQATLAGLDPLPRRLVGEHVAAIDELHRAALTKIVRTLRDDPRGKEILFDLVEEPVVHMVLAMHGIVRTADPTAQAERTLAALRPGIETHGGDVQLSHIEDGVAYVRLGGACNGCSMAGVTMRDGVEKALLEGVPSITAVEVLPNEPGGGSELLEIEGAAPAAPAASGESGWFKTFPAERIAPGKLDALSLQPGDGESVEVVVVNAAGRLAAYVNACAHQGMPLDNALVDDAEGTLTCPWHGFCFDSTNGECLTAPGAQLEQLPLRIEDGHIWIRAAAG